MCGAEKMCIRDRPMVEKQLASLTDPLWQKLVEALEASPLAQKYTQDEMFKIIYVIVEMCGSICYSSIIEELSLIHI